MKILAVIYLVCFMLSLFTLPIRILNKEYMKKMKDTTQIGIVFFGCFGLFFQIAAMCIAPAMAILILSL